MALFMQANTQRIKDINVIAPNPRPAAFVNTRRSQRILLAVPLLVTGTRTNGATFSERCKTVAVNAHGGLLALYEPLPTGQILTLKNLGTSEEIICRVMDTNPGTNGTPEVGVEFAERCPHFWRVSFPPADWSPHSAEAKRLTRGNQQASRPKTPTLPAIPTLTKK